MALYIPHTALNMARAWWRISLLAGLVKNKRYTIRLNAYTPLRDDWTNNEEYLVQLTLYDNHDNAMCVKDTQLMSLKAWQHEYSCFPHFTFAEHKMEMGMGDTDGVR
eukprot:42846_1